MAKRDNESTGDEEALDMRRTTARMMRGVVLLMVAATSLSAMALGAGAATKTATTISTAKDAKLGTILVAGTTVYTLKGNKKCNAACLKAWPPVLLPDGASAATAGNGVDGSKLGTKMLTNGKMQVTYAGSPLYWYVKDKKAGQVKGNLTDKWGKWATVVVQKAAGGSGSGGSGGSGGTGGSNAGTGGASF
jgi:predicted lipoprotein with Yx(FWY)xxD motif